MKTVWFSLGQLSVWAACVVPLWDRGLPALLMLGAWIGVLPVVVAVCTARALNLLRPVRILAAAAPTARRAWAAGMVAGILGMVVTTVAVVLLNNRVNDSLILGGAAMLATAGVLRMCCPIRLGYCVRCNYDLRGSQRSSRCPECGLRMRGLTALPGQAPLPV